MLVRKGSTTEQAGVMTRKRVLEIRRKRHEIARKKGSLAYYRHMRRFHAKRKRLAKTRRKVHPMPKPRPYRTGTSHVGRATRKYFVIPRVGAYPIRWFDTKEQQREWKKLKRLL